jgi:hypothetical protein
MVKSKSTEKLVEMKALVKETIETLSPEKADELVELSITWKEGSYDSGPLPELNMKFLS